MTHHPVRRTRSFLLLGFVLCLIASSQATAVDCPIPCNDINACTIDSCDTTTGTCRFDPRNCDDHNPCTNDVCFPIGAGGEGFGCIHGNVPAGTACDDRNSCTAGDACSSGQCVGQVQPEGTACDDRNSCSAPDVCDANGSCFGTPVAAGTDCDDQSQCTTGDTCQVSGSGGTVCQGTPKDCGDANLCTEDKCDPVTGQCGNPPVNCGDGNSCTADSCDPATGACVRTNVSGSCFDGNRCTPNDFCSGGNCFPGGPGNCDDHVACTGDFCIAVEGCFHSPQNQLCNDNNDCTTDTCQSFGCQYSFHGGPCASPNRCFNGICTPQGQCAPFTPIICNDNNPCTVDSCDSATGCVFTPLSPGSACEDFNSCTLNTACDASARCVGETQPLGTPCDDQSVCTSGDVCTNSGGSVVCRGTFGCDDNNACTLDVCNSPNGDCSHTTRSCDDGNFCTADACDPATGCTHQPVSQATCGVGACQRSITCPGNCVPGIPTAEVCNGIDDDCDGQVDEGLGTISCGLGACRREVAACVGGTPQTCTPGTPTTEICNEIDDDCDGEVDENKVQADCVFSPGTLNLNAQGSGFSFECRLTDMCDPSNPTPIPGAQAVQVYVSRADSAETPSDDVVLPDPFAAPCPDPTLGFFYEPGIAENPSARDNTNKGATFRFNFPNDGNCLSLFGDRQDLGALLAALPDNTNATLCISGKVGGIVFRGCTTALVRNKGNR